LIASTLLLAFDDQLIFYQHFDSKTTIEPNVFVLHRLWMLEVECNSVAIQLISQTLFMRGCLRSRAEKLVNLDGAANHAIGEVIEFQFRALRDLRGDPLPIL
jgi:hypothetical protein